MASINSNTNASRNTSMEYNKYITNCGSITDKKTLWQKPPYIQRENNKKKGP